MLVATTAPQTSRGLFVVGPYVSRMLIVEAVHKASLNCIWLYPHDNVIQIERIWISDANVLAVWTCTRLKPSNSELYSIVRKL
jgi:hypothetical protein